MDLIKKTSLVVCVNERFGTDKKSCAGSGSRELINIIKHRMSENNMDIPIIEQVCLGRCAEGVTMRIAPAGPFYTEVTEKDINDILNEINNFKTKT